MLPLRITSCLFASIVVHAHTVTPRTFRIDCYHHIFLAVTVLSILFHSTHDKIVGVIDKILAHAAFLFVIFIDTLRLFEQGHQWLMVFPLAVMCLWAVQTAWPSRANALHTVLHVVAAIGINCFIGLLI